MNKKKILIVGGTGFLGTNLILSLKKFRKFEITSISRKLPKKKLKQKNLKFISADLSNFENLKKNLKHKNYDVIINLGGNINHQDKKDTNSSHYELCKNLIKYFNSKEKLFIQAGSSLEYGKAKSPNLENIKCLPNTIYGKSKFKSTLLLKKSKFNYVALRLYQIYGPHQKINRIIPLAIYNLLKKNYFESSSGEQIRDFMYIDDFTQLILKILFSKNIISGVYNVGSGNPISVKKVLKKIEHLTGIKKINYNKIEMRKNEPRILYPSINKIKKKFNWTPKISLRKGLLKTIKFYEQY